MFSWKIYTFFKATEAVTESPEVFCKKDFLKILQYFESVFNKVSDLQDCNLIKKRLQHKYFPVIIAESLRAPTLKSIYEGLLWAC